MSSFKRKVTSKTQEKNLPGTKPLPGSLSALTTSSGIPSLDDILGGGLPLTCTQLILAPDAHSAYGELVQKYFVSQGLACGQKVCVVHEDARQFVEGCMWVPVGSAATATSEKEQDDKADAAEDSKIKIAWRYEQMKQFQTTVSSLKEDDYCRVFDLTSRIPAEIVDDVLSSKRLTTLDIDFTKPRSVDGVLKRIAQALGPEEKSSARRPLRICIPSLGSPTWGDLEPQDVCYFLYSLRATLRRYSHACASISLSPDLCGDSYGGSGWAQKLGWLSDACISLSAFTANPSLTATFPSYHGFVHIHSLPAPLSLVPASDKYSSLRGLSSSGENNLAFKCMRKRLVVETLHLDLEGGVSERRTTPATSSIETAIPPRHSHGPEHNHDHAHNAGAHSATDRAVVEIQLEQVQKKTEVGTGQGQEIAAESTTTTATVTKKPKQRKKVAFTSDRPDLYDF